MYEEALEKYINTLSKESHTSQWGTIPYRLSVPTDYKDKKYPVVLFMHGAGERGNDNELPLRAAVESFLANNPVVRDAIFMFPQCPEEHQWVNTPWYNVNYSVADVPESWEIKTVLEALENVVEKYNADTDRLYVMGLSMGGYATWDIISRHGELFAAAMPICGGADVAMAEKLKDIPIQTFHGDLDDSVPVQGTRNIVEAIKKYPDNKLTYTELTGYGHFVWDEACATEGIGEWMFSKRLSDRR